MYKNKKTPVFLVLIVIITYVHIHVAKIGLNRTYSKNNVKKL